MAAKKKNSLLNKQLDGDTEAIALGSIISILIAIIINSIIFAIPLGLIFAFAHKHGLTSGNKKKTRKK